MPLPQPARRSAAATDPKTGTPPAAKARTVRQGGRLKAYRPLPIAARAAAVRDGLEAYERGDVFQAHELLEPAWMGSNDLIERDLIQGLIKLAAGFVHAARDNPRGVAKNLRGARARLAAAGPSAPRMKIADLAAIDYTRLIRDMERILERVERDGDVPVSPPRIPHRGPA